jgi:hypothetical protein
MMISIFGPIRKGFVPSAKQKLYHFWLLVVQSAQEAVYEYFFPVRALFIPYQGKKLFEIDKKISRLEKNILIIRKAICYNQGAYIQHSYICSENHKAVKEYYNSGVLNDFKDFDVSVLKEKTSYFLNFLNKDLYKNIYKNYELLQAYFVGRDSVRPRLSIKGVFKTHGDEDKIITIFRDHNADYIADLDYLNNTAIKHVVTTGTYFIDNNIPVSVANDVYVNSRIDKDKVNELIGRHSSYGKALKKIRGEWDQCWVGSGSVGNEQSHYKSTLVIPITLWNNNLTNEFKNIINKKDDAGYIGDVDRYIFGLLCMDHVSENYFDEDCDVSVGYIFADMISLYIFNRVVYTEISNSFSKVEDYLDKSSVVMQLEKMKILVDEMFKNIAQKDYLIFDKKSTDCNYFVPVDDGLMEYISTKSHE